MVKRVFAVLLALCMFNMSAKAYEYIDCFDPITGTRTFYLSFDQMEMYKPFSSKVEIKSPEDTIAEIAEAEIESEPSTEADVEEAKPVYGDIVLSEEDANALRWVLCLEEEGFEEECRVCEAIFNRVLSEKDWGNSVGEVLAKKGQFSTYRLIGSSKAWDTPGELEDDVISEVLRETSTRLPSKRYVYFDSKGGKNGRDHVKYGNTTYGRE